MLSVNTYNQKGEVVGKTQLDEKVFGVKWNADLVHQAVVAQMANRRQVLAHTKDKGEVRGGGRKPWRQKGTGRARHGSIRSPLWRGGGVTFGPTNLRNFKKKINKKMKRKALFMALSSKVWDKQMIVLDGLVLEKPKTKEMSGILVGLFSKISPSPGSSPGQALTLPLKKGEGKEKEAINAKQQAKVALFKKDRSEILLVLPQKNQDIQRASQNLPYLKTILADSLNVVDVLKYRYLLIVKDAIGIIKKHYILKSKIPGSNVKQNPKSKK